MKALIKHLVENNMPEILEKSLLNCHVIGVHSIMLLNSPGKTIRLYVADKNHELYKNVPESGMYMSVAYHPHHCNITIQVTAGILRNDTVEETESGLRLNKFLYNSEITNGKIGFTKTGSCLVSVVRTDCVYANDSISLEADEIHTVSVEKNEVSAWLVFEGKEDANYKPYCLSNADLENQSFDQLYQKPTQDDIIRLLNLSNLYPVS